MANDKERKVLNDEQKAAVYHTGNVVAAAGAGSGKTTVLASRYAWLVTEKNYRVSEILTLTFTRKAAVQMYRSIYLLLSQIARDVPGEKGKRAARAIDEFSSARIQTLDSYSTSLVKQAAGRYGISPDFSVDEERCRQLALDLALPFLISRRNHPAIQRLYPRKSPAAIAHDIFASGLFDFTGMDLSRKLSADISFQFDIICDEWKKRGMFISDKLKELSDVYAGNEKYHPALAPLLDKYNKGGIVIPNVKELRDFFDQLPTVPADSLIDWAEAHPIQNRLVKILDYLSSVNDLDMRIGSPRKNPAKDIVYELKDAFGEFSSLVVYCLQAGLVYSVLSFLSDLQNQYVDKKRTEGILTFADISRLARTILLEQPDIRQNEKEAYKAIMIDEFQDNNEQQKDLLFLLAEKPGLCGGAIPQARDLSPDKLFFVGDEKQSIYRFRGADVSVFRRLKSELNCPDLPLKTNYRSAPLLIDTFNTIFGGTVTGPDPVISPSVFVPDGALLPLYEASYTPLRAGLKTGSRENEGKTTLCILDKKDSDNFDEGDTERQTSGMTARLPAVENEARYVAEKIRDLLNVKNESGGPQYRPQDIAILFRSRKPQHLFEKHLRLLDIPYASEDLNGFFYGGPVNDIMSVLRLAAYPSDRAAYAEMLRSPFAGLSLPGLVQCFSVLNEATEGSSTDDLFGEEAFQMLSGEDREKYRHGQRIYQKIRDSACTESISSLVSELWYGEGYRYETEWNPQTAVYRELYDYLFHLAVQADEDNLGLAAFTDSIHDSYETGETLSGIEIPLERPSAVHLMTVHKSKGLEFPVVFICCCDKRGQSGTSGDIFDTGQYGITLNPPLPPQCDGMTKIKRNYFWERSLTLERGKRTAELRRLLYVAMTRCQNELYLSGCLGIDSAAAGMADNDFLSCVKRYIDERAAKNNRKNSIEGDTIFDNDTFFGLCLPSFGAHITGNTDERPPFFGIEKIPLYNDEYIRDTERQVSGLSNDQEGLEAFFRLAQPFYDKGGVIKTPSAESRYYSAGNFPVEKLLAGAGTSPSSAASDGAQAFDHSAGLLPSPEFSGEGAQDIFAGVDVLLDRYAKQHGEDVGGFTSASFGTIAHICTEALLAGKEAVIPPKLSGSLNPADGEVFLRAGKELALRFSRSPLGIIAGKSSDRANEFPFRSLVRSGESEIFINGIIDLIFQDDRTVYVVDFKTDKTESPYGHIAQMACYYRAATDLFAGHSGKDCRIWIYYLRTGRAVEVSGPAAFAAG